MGEILLAYGLPKETVKPLMMLYKNMKAMVHPLDGNTDFFNIVIAVLQGDTLVPYMFIICLDYVLWMFIDWIKEKAKKKARSRQYQTKTETDEDYANNLALFANTPTLAKSLLHSLEKVVEGIGLHVNTNKTKFTFLKEKEPSPL